MTDVARRQARTQKHRLDGALLDRRRQAALADLGEALYDLAVRGEIELDELPELAERVSDVEAIDREIAEAEREGGAERGRMPVRLRPTGAAAGAGEGRARDRVAEAFRERVGGALREGLGERVGGALRDRVGEGFGALRDELGERVEGALRDRGARRAARDTRDDPHADERGGAVTSAEGAGHMPPRRPGPPERVWRPSLDDVPDPPERRPAPDRPVAVPGPDRGGGIVFVDDEPSAGDDPDGPLEAYMHDDDVPRRR